MDYEKLLDNVRSKLPESVKQSERFEIPNVRGHIQGNKTILTNLKQIADTLRRPLEHIIKFLLKELATPGELKSNNAVVVGSKIPASRINEKIRQYAKQFVLCQECGKPDTQIKKEEGRMFLKCQACGSKLPIKTKLI